MDIYDIVSFGNRKLEKSCISLSQEAYEMLLDGAAYFEIKPRDLAQLCIRIYFHRHQYQAPN
ncbi:MAG: hypothetical protein D6767_06010, partial [Candidatus Hydrogenedentota bacterium]